jgi:hypothetical protein
MLRRVALVRTDVSEERKASIISFATLMMEALRYPEMSLFTRATRPNSQEDGTHHSHRRKNIKSYIALTGWAM